MTLVAEGVQSGMTYLQDAYSQYNSSGDGTWIVPVIPNMDTEVTFYVVSPAGGAAFTGDWAAWGDPEPDSAQRLVNPASQVRVMTGGGQSGKFFKSLASGATGTAIDAPGVGYSIRLQRAGVYSSVGSATGEFNLTDSEGTLTNLSTPANDGQTTWQDLNGQLAADNSAVTYANGTGQTTNLTIRYDIIRTPYLRNGPT
jgi:hypothetical protein